MSADGRCHPAWPGEPQPSLDACVVGPSGLVDLLSIQLGLTSPAISPVVRIAAWQKKLEAAAASRSRFWSASFDADPWSTARLILGWRDELREAGWHNALSPPALPRLADIAAAEVAGPRLPPSRGDRLCEITARLEAGDRARVTRVDLIDARASLPGGYAALLDALAAGGTVIEERAVQASAAPLSDLGRVQAYLTSGTIQPLVGDGSVVEIVAGTSLMAAEALGEWIAHCPHSDGRGTVVVAPDGDTALIDMALTRRGLPPLGYSAASPQRGALQVLPLAFATAFGPFDAQRIVEMMLLPRPPLPRWLASRVARSLARQPGCGIVLSDEFWSDAATRLANQQPETTPEERAALIEGWREWIDVGQHDPEAGIGADAARGIAARVRDWALRLDGGKRDPLLLCVVGAADAIDAALQLLDRSPVGKLQIERMIDQALAEGLCNPDHIAGAGALRSASSAGGLWAPTPHVVWWNFSAASADGMCTSPWSAAERAALAMAGCALPTSQIAAARHEADWCRAALLATETLVLVRSELDRGATSGSHPLAHRLAPLLRPHGGARPVEAAAEELLRECSASVGARTIARQQATSSAPAGRRPVWETGHDLAARIAERVESATSLEDMLGCQLKWFLKHVARLSAGSLEGLPDSRRMLGNLAHALAAEVFVPGRIPDPETVERETIARIEALIDAMAAPLRQPGRSSELADARARLPGTLAAFARLLADAGISVEAMEEKLQADLDEGMKLEGRLDMRISTSQGPGVIDIKWSGKSHGKRLEAGTAVQLAAYARLAGAAPVGYYVLEEKRLYSGEAAPLPGDVVAASRSAADTFNAAVADWTIWRHVTASGRLIAGGLDSASEHLPPGLDGPPSEEACRYCDYRALCRLGA